MQLLKKPLPQLAATKAFFKISEHKLLYSNLSTHKDGH